MRLIDADKLIMYVADCKLSESITWEEAELITDFLRNAPSVESRPKGKWIAYAEEDTPIMLRCSMCTHSVVWGSIANYCPNCGADMRGDNHETDRS